MTHPPELVDVSVLDQLGPLVQCRLRFPRPRLDDVPGEVKSALARLPALGGLEQGQRVAVTAGSRGITGIAPILRAACEYLRTLGVEPVVVSAMGSHGGGTAAGQRDLLRSLGITEEALGGTPVICSAETDIIGHTPDGLAVHADRFTVREVHGVLVVNRVKPHTAFRGPTESGLLKMLAVGLGRQPGATIVHSRGPGSMCAAIRSMAAVSLEKLPVLGGLAILENGYEETAEIVPLMAQEFLSREETLLARARELLPRLPLAAADILVVEQIGKEVSGTGMDTNITGRWGDSDPGPEAGPTPGFRRVVVLDLTPSSHGNATGIGLADFTTDRVVQAMDRRVTYTNCLTSTLIDRARLPLFLPDDRQALAAAVLSLGEVDRGRASLVQIRDTLHLDVIRVSAHVVGKMEPPPGVTVEVEEQPGAFPMGFDAGGRLARLPAPEASG
ncbi:MAG: hypothetical protein Q8P31_07800 [Bacillota bacterium]|nr:hypothetical protein [Bacillota bacterium]